MNRIPVTLPAAFILAGLFLASCAGAPERPLPQLTVSEIVASGMKEIALRDNQLVCAGKKTENLDQVEGIMVKGVLCEEPEHMSFLYLFNGEPFFLAIMGINQSRDELKPLMGFGAMEQRGLMTPVDLNSRPRLPLWAYDKDGKPVKSIYNAPAQPVESAPQSIR